MAKFMGKMMQHFRRILASPPFTKYLLVTNIVSGGTIDFVGDQITQRKLEGAESPDWSRTGRMVTIALLLGGPAHYWYIYLERWFPLKTSVQIAKKLVVDTLVGGPFFLSSFYVGE